MTTIAQSTDAPSRLVAQNLTLGYGDRIIVDGLDLEIPTGVITTVIGPNGCGKSTLLRALGRLLKPKGGSVILDGKAISSMKTKEVARVLGMLPRLRLRPKDSLSPIWSRVDATRTSRGFGSGPRTTRARSRKHWS
ncbi:hypothetical protein GCM10020255_081540 [Rhodococcus baikonurensis]